MKNQVTHEKITKPIQLLSAWLTGLFSVNAGFLFAASNMTEGSTESLILVWAAVFNVPIFLLAVFLLQTKFRPELQEDSYYATYLDRKTNQQVNLNVSKSDKHIVEIDKRIVKLETLIAVPETSINLRTLKVGVNKGLSDAVRIVNKLHGSNIAFVTAFGNGELHPNKNLAVSRYLSEDVRGEVLKLAKELGAERYTIFDNVEEGTEEDVLIGAYGDAEYII